MKLKKKARKKVARLEKKIKGLSLRLSKLEREKNEWAAVLAALN